jgi:hypothetical protein
MVFQQLEAVAAHLHNFLHNLSYPQVTSEPPATISILCTICVDLALDAQGYWHPFPYGKQTPEQLQQSAPTCPSGGCKILLKANEKCVPDAFGDETTFQQGRNPGEIGVTVLGQKHIIQLFFDGDGMYSEVSA